jgi:hypothetical protein
MKAEVRTHCFLEGNQLRFIATDRAALDDLDQFVSKQIASAKLAQTFVQIDPNQRLPQFSMTRSNEAVVTAASASLLPERLHTLQNMALELAVSSQQSR